MASDTRVLILSPRDESAGFFTRLLAGLSLEAVRCIEMDQFQSALKGRPPVLVICDSKFPQGTFEDVLEIVKAKCSGTPVVVSGIQDWDEYLHALQFDAFDCINSQGYAHEAERTITAAIWESVKTLRAARSNADRFFARNEAPLRNPPASSWNSARNTQDAP